MLGQIDFLGKARAANFTSVYPLAAVDLTVPAEEAQTLKIPVSKVTMQWNGMLFM